MRNLFAWKFDKLRGQGNTCRLTFNHLFYPGFLLLLFAVLSLPIKSQTTTASPAPTPTPLTDAQKKKVSDVNKNINAARQLIRNSEEFRVSASGADTQISSLNSYPEIDDQALRNLEELTKIVKYISANGILENLTKSDSDLEKILGELTKTRNALDPESDSLPSEISYARQNSDAALEDITKQRAAAKKAKDKIQQSLSVIPGAVKALAELGPLRLTPLNDLANNAPAESVLRTVPNQLPVLVRLERWRRTARDRWNDLRIALREIGSENTTANTGVDNSLATLDTSIVTQIKKVPDWTTTLTTFTKGKISQASTTRDNTIKDPPTNAATANALVREIADLADNVRKIEAAWTDMTLQLQAVVITGFDPTPSDALMKELSEQIKSVNISSSNLQDAVAGSAENFQSDRISLFYYTDVERIMKMLNPATYEEGGIKGAKGQAALQRQKLTEAELDLITARGVIAKYQTEIQNLEEQLRVAKTKFNLKEQLLRKTTINLQNTQRSNTAYETNYNNAKADADANPNDALKKAALGKATEERDRGTSRLQETEEANKDAQRERDEANEELTAAKDEQTGLPTKIRQARDSLEAAQAAVDRQRKLTILTAQTENEAFAMARDNRPFWFGPASAASTDPAKRVLMYAFSDDKTIFLRGKADDIKVVKNIIAQFDRPAPQARLTLWTLEMSSDTSSQGTKNFNNALQIIEGELANNRALTAATLSFLRDCINYEVNSVADSYRTRVSVITDVGQRNRIARLYFYQPEVLARLGIKLDRSKDLDAQNAKEILQFNRLSVPDPAGTTTLGESLMILSLTTPASRNRIMTNFRNNLQATLKGLGLFKAKELPEQNWADSNTILFPSTMRILDGSMLANSDNAMPSMQLEVLKAAEKLAVKNVYSRVQELYGVLAKAENEYRSESVNPIKKIQLEALRRNLVSEIVPQLNWLRVNYGFLPKETDLEKLKTSNDPAVQRDATNNTVKQVLDTFVTSQELNPLRTANAREAAADQLLKELIIAFEDDLDRHFMQPMINRLRQKITREKVGVGIGVMQRTSMLATNRLLARVDPRASAELGVGEQTNILQSVQQLAQIASAWQLAGPLGALNAADAVPRQAPPEIYGITSGNTFQVTPIFDPSGQALRFKFDFMGVTNIQEPNGSTNRALPRIERHTVNTEVQLSNMETREISRFESNSRVGRPTEYSGGLPIFRDIPYVKQIPLIGWFIRRGGKAAVVQQSLIFGQTTMYPTIGDIMDLLTDQPVVFGGTQ